ncbi:MULTISPECIES: hypothetical protein [unclassified Kitasatospora]|uniref:hypothetical protein n=1 Tax=unclassified Kitasatospora TaxID=2633591 RepID=UPI0006714882|nr:hypothetical protein [Kitasatospora sp. MY 5-36]
MRSHRRTALVVAATGLALLTGCSSGGSAAPATGGTGGQAAAPALTATPTPTTVADTQQLPLRAFAASPQELTGIAKAQGLLTQDCMKRLGFASWQPNNADLTKAGKDDMPTPYGFLNEAQAAQYGFHQPGTAGGAKVGSGSPMNPAEFTALSGLKSPTGGEPAGGSTPPGGCTGEADRKLKGDKPPAADVYGDLTGQSMNRTKADARVVAATTEWASCMKQRGYAYGNPESLSTESWGPTVTQREIDTAKADVACTRQTNLSGIAFGVQSAIQKQLIEQHDNELKAYRAAIQSQLDQAATVLREHGQ